MRVAGAHGLTARAAVRAVAGVAGLALIGAPWLPWYEPPRRLILFEALDRLPPFVLDRLSLWDETPVLAAALTAAGVLVVAGAIRARVPAWPGVAAGLVAAVLGMLLRPGPFELATGAVAEARIGAGGPVALAAVLVAAASLLLSGRRSRT